MKIETHPHRPADPHETDRLAVLETMLMDAAFDGWTETVLTRAVAEALPDAPPGHGAILFPGGIRDVLDFWSIVEDQKLADAYAALEEPPTRIRDKVTWLVKERIDAFSMNREAARRAAATLALPTMAGAGLAQAWRTADTIWRALGDQSMDGNYYSKRATLSAVYLSTLTRWFADKGEGDPEPWADSWAFLDKRIEGVMQFEKVKARVQKGMPDMQDLVRGLAKMRYGRETAGS